MGRWRASGASSLPRGIALLVVLLLGSGRLAAQDPPPPSAAEDSLPSIEAIAVDGAGGVSGKGVHGVVVQLGGRTGVLLPQVAAREGWDGPTLVFHAAHKAGIGEHEIAHASIRVFSSESF